ncbi:MAG TPA: ELWxxDGT repeat protein [Tepidisphaeraceae bacterium]|jgi:ELWxxDGT repeat protein|nr:ELWxxDGT repeat protein [Tepidisphaeraceae bacterium]
MRRFRSRRISFTGSPRAQAEPLEPRRLLSVTSLQNFADTPTAPSSATIGQTLFFVNSTPATGYELWKSDGTAAGTVLVKDIFPGASSSSPSQFTAMDGILYFTASDPTHGLELWKSDGTSTGTVMVKDIFPGTEPSSPTNLTAIGNTLYFGANDGAIGVEPWKSDGTSAGTILIKDIAANGSSHPCNFTSANGNLFFTASPYSDYSADATASGGALYKSDGTAAGTVLLTAANGYADSLVAIGSIVYFVNNGSATGQDVWRSDGTIGGTYLLKDVDQGRHYRPNDLVAAGDKLFFVANDNIHGTELWTSDGTPGNTTLVKDLLPGTNGSSPEGLTAVGNTLYFFASDGTSYGLWKTDGSDAGTILVKGSVTRPTYLLSAACNGLLYFQAGDALWVSDGTSAGTNQLGGPGYGAGFADGILSILPATNTGNSNTLVYFFGGNSSLWKTDGTSRGTAPVTGLSLPTSGATIDNLTPFGNRMFFTVESASSQDLWMSDGTVAGTIDLHAASTYGGICVCGSWLYFSTIGGSTSTLWKANAAGNVQLVKSIPSFNSISNLTDVNGTLFFSATDSSNGTELWQSDGTTVGTALVKDINPGSASSNPTNLTNVNGTLFFSATDSTNGTELWKSDGTAAGTVLVKDIYPGTTGSAPERFSSVGTLLLFTANDGVHGEELWSSNGMAAGTTLVKDIYPGSSTAFNSYDSDYAVMDGYLYFGADNGSIGRQLWRSDGTAAGTTLVKRVSTIGSSAIMDMFVGLGSLYFGAYDGYSAVTLWKSDGTSTGTTVVQTWAPETSPAYPESYFVLGSTIFFFAEDSVHGTELWRTDGTSAGTAIVNDFYPGDEKSLIYSEHPLISGVGGSLFVITSQPNNTAALAVLSTPSAAGPLVVHVPESGSIQLDAGGVFAPDLVDPPTYSWDLDGDGVFGETGASATRGDEIGASPILNVLGIDGPATLPISLKATNSIGSSTISGTITITNIAPTESIDAVAPNAAEGDTLHFTGSTTDPSPADMAAGLSLHWTVTRQGQLLSTATTTSSTSDTSFDFQPTDNGDYVVSLTATDKDGASTTTSQTFHVNNVAPTATLNDLTSIAGLQALIQLTNISDPSSADLSAGLQYSFDLDGDGIFETTSSSPSATKTYLTSGAHTVRARVRDKDGGENIYTATVNVSLPDGPVTLLTSNGPVDEGSSATVSFLQTTGTGPFTYNYDFDNDGIFEIAGSSSATATVPASYLTDGPFTRIVHARVVDSFGQIADLTTDIQVLNVPPTLQIAPASNASVILGETFTLSVDASDPGTDHITSWDINWGDQHSDTISASAGLINHLYTTSGQYHISITTHDEDGSYSDTRSIAVTATPPSATVSATSLLTSNIPYRFPVTYTDDLGIDPATLGDNDLQITGPSGTAAARFISSSQNGSRASLTAIYEVDSPLGTWSWQDNGVYSVIAQPGAITDLQGLNLPAGSIGTFSVALGMPIAPDLSAQLTGSIPKSFAPGAGTYTVNLKVQNQGVQILPITSVTTRLYLSTDPLSSSDDILIGSSTQKFGLPINGSFPVSITFPSPKVPTSGRYYLIAKVDTNNNVAERDERNNVVVSSPMTITAPTVDLALSLSSKLTATSKAGQHLPLSLKIANNGNIDAVGKASLRIYFSNNSVLDSSDTLLVNYTLHLKLKSKASTPFNYSIKIPPSAAKGKHFLLIVLNSPTLNDHNAANNSLSKAIKID